MVRNGADIERVKAAVTAEGANPDLIDDRTPAQRAHDDAYGMPHRVDPQSYYFSLPSAAEIGDPAAFSNDLRGVVARLEPAVATAPPLAINPAPRGRRLIETG